MYTHSKAKTENSKETFYAQRTRVGEKRVISFFEETLPSFSMEKRVHWNGLPRYGIMSGEITFSIKVAPRINFRPF